MTWIFYLIYLYIFGAEGSVFLSFPSTDWKNSSKVCTLPSRQNVEHASKLLVEHGVEQAWTGTRVVYSRWAAFAGCLDDITQATQRLRVSLDDCAVECSRDSNNKLFAYKNEECFCFGEVQSISTDAHICRQLCTNDKTSDIACHTGNSALLFRFIEVTNARISNKYIEKECISTTPQNGTRFVENCDTKLRIHCEDNQVQIRSENWYAYQKECFKGTVLSLNITNSDSLSTEFRYWTPIFRRNILQLDQSEAGGCNKALVLNNNGRIEVANCTDQLPFLCSSNHTKEENFGLLTTGCQCEGIIIGVTCGSIAVLIVIGVVAFVMKRPHTLLKPNITLPGNNFGNPGISNEIEDSNQQYYDLHENNERQHVYDTTKDGPINNLKERREIPIERHIQESKSENTLVKDVHIYDEATV